MHFLSVVRLLLRVTASASRTVSTTDFNRQISTSDYISVTTVLASLTVLTLLTHERNRRFLSFQSHLGCYWKSKPISFLICQRSITHLQLVHR